MEGKFEPLRTRGYVAIAAIAGVCLLHVTSFAADAAAILGWGDLGAFERAVEMGDGGALALGLGAGVLALGGLAFFVASVIAYSFWLYRAAANSRVFSDAYSWSPGETVGAHFIPFVNLYRPKQAMDAIHAASDPDAVVPADVSVWWGCWVATNVIGTIEMRLGDRLIGTDYLILNGLGETLFVVAGALLVGIVLRVTRVQEERSTKLAAEARSMPLVDAAPPA